MKTSDAVNVDELEWRLWPQGNNKVIVYQNNEIETIITPEAVTSEQGEWVRQKHSEALTTLRKRIEILERAVERRNTALDDINKINRELVSKLSEAREAVDYWMGWLFP